MQINIDRKTGVLLGVIVLLAAAVVSLSVNRSDNGDTGSSSGHMGHGSSSSSNANYTGADIMFLQMMIPHHQQAIDMSDLALTKSTDSELLALAKDIRDGQAAEIITMKAWLAKDGADLDPGHSMGDSMGGMLSESELVALKAATGKSFDLLWLKGMTGHHDGAIHMATMIEDASNPEIKSFGQAIVTTQSAQNKQMAAMIKRMG